MKNTWIETRREDVDAAVKQTGRRARQFRPRHRSVLSRGGGGHSLPALLGGSRPDNSGAGVCATLARSPHCVSFAGDQRGIAMVWEWANGNRDSKPATATGPLRALPSPPAKFQIRSRRKPRPEDGRSDVPSDGNRSDASPEIAQQGLALVDQGRAALQRGLEGGLRSAQARQGCRQVNVRVLARSSA
jgi:hypothetical protein